MHHDINFVFCVDLANIILSTLGKKSFWDKLLLDIIELDVEELALPWESKLLGHFDDGVQQHYRQLAKCL